MSLVVVGSVAFDSIKTGTAEKEMILGGSATYFSIAASRYTDVSVVAVVGDDFTDEHVSKMIDKGVDVQGLERIEGGKTFSWSGVYSDDFVERTTIFTHLNVFETFDPKLTSAQKDSDILFLANIHPELQLNVLDQMSNVKFVACDTMNCWINDNLDSFKKVLKNVDLLSINDEESYLLSGKKNIHQAAKIILDLGVEYLIIKRGEFGAVLYSKNEMFMMPAYPVTNVVDPTGAGDSFGGGLIGYIAKSEKIDFDSIKRAMIIGTITASFTVEEFSVDRLFEFSQKEFDERLDRFAKLTNWEKFENPVE